MNLPNQSPTRHFSDFTITILIFILTALIVLLLASLTPALPSTSVHNRQKTVDYKEPANGVTHKVPYIEIVNYPLAAPLQRPTDEQLLEAAACEIDAIEATRYPIREVRTRDLRSHYKIDEYSGCDWAILASAYATRVSPAEKHRVAAHRQYAHEGLLAFANAVNLNPAYLVVDSLFDEFIDAAPMVAPLSFSQRVIQLNVDYSWTGEGAYTSWEVVIRETDRGIVVSGMLEGEPINYIANLDHLPTLHTALGGLIPVDQMHPLEVCYNDYPEWYITITFEDGSELFITNAGSNIYVIGGPWWVEIDNQLYFTYAITLAEGLKTLVVDLKLRLGQPGAMFCGGLNGSMLEKLYD